MARKETIFVRPQRALDRFNDPTGPVPDWREIPGATCVPRNSNEDDKRGPIVVAGFMVALNSPMRDIVGEEVPIEFNWEVQIRGEVHQIEGDVGDYGRKLIFYTMRVK